MISISRKPAKAVTPEEASAMLNAWREAGVYVACDIETAGLNPHVDMMYAIGFCPLPQANAQPIMVCLNRDLWNGDNDREYFAPLKPYFETCDNTIWHNGKFDAGFISVRLGVMPRNREDTLLMAYAIDPGRSAYKLDSLATSELGIESWKHLFDDIDGLFGKRALADYLGSDVVVTAALYERFDKIIGADSRLQKLYAMLQVIDDMLTRISLNGIPINQNKVADWAAKLAVDIVEAGGNENIVKCARSPKFCKDFLANAGLVVSSTSAKPLRRTVTTSGCSEELKAFVESVLEYRELLKRQSTYIPLLAEAGNRLYPSFLIHRTITGRLASSPNVQNLPPDAKPCIEAPDGYSLVEVDFAQHELRTLAWITGDDNLKKALLEGDLHSITAELAFGSAEGKFRKMAKTANFGMIYSGSVGSMVEMGVPPYAAEKLLHVWNEEFAVAMKWLVKQAAVGQYGGTIKTAFKRQRKFDGNRKVNGRVKSQANEARNYHIQSAASDIALLTSVEVANRGYKIVNLVHDSMLIEVSEGTEQETIKSITKLVKDFTLNLTGWDGFGVDGKYGKSWDALE